MWWNTHDIPNYFLIITIWQKWNYFFQGHRSTLGSQGGHGVPAPKKETTAALLLRPTDNHVSGGMWSSMPSTLITDQLCVCKIPLDTVKFTLAAFWVFSEDKTNKATYNVNQWAARRELSAFLCDKGLHFSFSSRSKRIWFLLHWQKS